MEKRTFLEGVRLERFLIDFRRTLVDALEDRSILIRFYTEQPRVGGGRESLILRLSRCNTEPKCYSATAHGALSAPLTRKVNSWRCPIAGYVQMLLCILNADTGGGRERENDNDASKLPQHPSSSSLFLLSILLSKLSCKWNEKYFEREKKERKRDRNRCREQQSSRLNIYGN